MRKKLRQNVTVSRARMWDELPWKPVNVENENLGEFEDAVFFGLEEIDGNAYKLMKDQNGVVPAPVVESSENAEEPVKKTKKSKKAVDTATEQVTAETVPEVDEQPKKAKKEKKRSRDEPSEGETTTEVVQVSKKKSKKAASSERVNQQADEVMEVDDADKSVHQWGPLPSLKSIYINAPAPVLKEDVQYLRDEAEWAPGLKVSKVLSQALKKLGFATPTPIQQAAIPLITPGNTDVVGAAETGSGKTLAFCLPIIHSLLRNWDTCSNIRIPHALIIAPTRELALQISTVLREVCAAVAELCAQQGQQGDTFASAEEGDDHSVVSAKLNTSGLSKKAKKALLAAQRRNGTAPTTSSGQKLSPATAVSIQVVSIVGGMSEHKQRRQLAGKGKPVHIVVATPGRLCEMFEDPDNVSFQDMSRLRWLVVDEADRIMEEGHYPELHRVFSRIRDHEEIAERGEDPIAVLKARRTGTFVVDDGELADAAGLRKSNAAAAAGRKGASASANREGVADGAEGDLGDEEIVEDLDLGEVEVPMMPSEEEIARMREECAALGVEEYHKDAHLVDEDTSAEETANGAGKVYHENVGRRQTLLFSATAIHSHSISLAVFDKKARAQAKKLKLRGTLKGLSNDATLPDHLKQLLAQVGIQKDIHLVDVTASALGTKAGKGKDKASTGASADDGSVVSASKAGAASGSANVTAGHNAHTLPAGLTQEEIHVPTDEKDVYAYYYINKYPGRTLVFVNSIKTARRLDGLLRALGINSRALHAQLQQKQRLHALETFTDLPVGVLVATDVAARGLDIPKIQSVIHYDAARSPQVYVHRSGRTARANQTGTAVSLVSPEDAMHHRVICEYLGLKALPLLPVDLYTLPILRQRVTLAKQIFVQSFVASQKSKDKHWLKQSCKDADLDIDDNLAAELGARDEEDDIAESLDMDDAQKEALSKKAIAALKAQLQTLLDAPLPDAHSFNKMQKQRARAEARGGKAPTALVAATAAKPRAGRKTNKRVEPVTVDNTWKKRSSFFVFAK